MGKKKKGLGVLDYLIIILVLFVTVVCTVGYYLLILLPPLLLILGFIKNVFKMLHHPKVNSLKDFDLSSLERKKLSELKEKNDTFERILKRIEINGATISKRKDGLYSERSKLGKELNEQLNEIEPEYIKITKECKRLEGLPEKRKNNWLNIKSSIMASLFSIPSLIFLLATFISKPFNFVNLTYHYITIIPKFLSNLGIGLIFLVDPSLENSWLAKIYQFYPDYHAPILVSSLIAVVLYLCLKPIFFSITKNKLNHIDNQNNIERENSNEQIFSKEIQEKQVNYNSENVKESSVENEIEFSGGVQKADSLINSTEENAGSEKPKALSAEAYKNILFGLVAIAAIDGEITENEFNVIESVYIEKYWQEKFGDKQKFINDVENALVELFKEDPIYIIEYLENRARYLSKIVPRSIKLEIPTFIEKVIKADGKISESGYGIYKKFCENLGIDLSKKNREFVQ